MESLKCLLCLYVYILFLFQGTQSKVSRGTEYREALFNHVVNGINYFTGEKGVRMDFISLHRKVPCLCAHSVFLVI